MDRNWPHNLPLDRRLLLRVFNCSDKDLFDEFLRKFRSMISGQKWREILGSLIFHLCVDVLIDECMNDSVVLLRVLEFGESQNLDRVWFNGAFACLCRSRVAVAADLFDKFFVGFSIADTARSWPCVCSSGCDSARRMCANFSFVDLSLKSLNYVFLNGILSRPNSSASPSGHVALHSVFTCSLQPEAQARTLEVLYTFFPENTCPEFYAAAKLFSILTDACSGALVALPIEKIGGFGRACKPIMSTLSGALLLAAKIPVNITGRDAIFRFLLDMKIDLCDTILETVLFSNPDFWIPQAKLGSPATMLLEFVKKFTPKFLFFAAHLVLTAKCFCSLCSAWPSDKRTVFIAWLDAANLLKRMDAYRLLLGRTDKVVECSCWPEIVDLAGNTVLHVTQSETVIHLLTTAVPALLLARNHAGATPLDVAVRERNEAKIETLIKLGAALTGFALNRSACTPVWELELEQLQAKVGGLEAELSLQTVALNENTKKTIADLIAKQEQSNVTYSAKLAKTEALLNQSLRERSELVTQREEMETRLKRLEKSRSKLDKVRKEFESENETRECALCMERSWDTALACGHCYCLVCVQNVCVTACPTCSRKTGGKFTKLFIFKKT